MGFPHVLPFTDSIGKQIKFVLKLLFLGYCCFLNISYQCNLISYPLPSLFLILSTGDYNSDNTPVFIQCSQNIYNIYFVSSRRMLYLYIEELPSFNLISLSPAGARVQHWCVIWRISLEDILTVNSIWSFTTKLVSKMQIFKV